MTTEPTPDWTTFDFSDWGMVEKFESEILELAGNPETSPAMLHNIGNRMTATESAHEIAEALFGNPSTPAATKKYLEVEFNL